MHPMQKHYKYIVATIYAIVLFLDRLDLTIVNVTLPTVARYFDVSIVETDWISLAFLLALAISIPISSWLGDRFGLKRIYIVAMFLFGVGSTLCFFASSLHQLIFFRFLEGIGGGMLIPVGMTMIYRIYDQSEYADITSFTFLPSLIAPAIAPFLGGLIVDSFGWHFVFLCSGPICLVLAITSIFLIKEEPHQPHSPFDWQGFIVGEMILMDIFYGLSQLGKEGFSLSVIVMIFILLPLIWLFITIEKKQLFPLINLNFFKNKLFASINLVQLCFQVCHFGAIFLVGLFLQVGIGFSAALSGLMMGMQAIGSMTTIRYSVKLYHQYGAKLPIILGFSGIAIITPMIMLIDKPERFVFGLFLFFMRGVFSGLCGTPMQTLSVIGFNKKDIGTINSIFNTGRQVSISLGVAISSLLIAFGLYITGLNGTENIPYNQVFSVFCYGFWAVPLIALLGMVITYNMSISEDA